MLPINPFCVLFGTLAGWQELCGKPSQGLASAPSPVGGVGFYALNNTANHTSHVAVVASTAGTPSVLGPDVTLTYLIRGMPKTVVVGARRTTTSNTTAATGTGAIGTAATATGASASMAQPSTNLTARSIWNITSAREHAAAASTAVPRQGKPYINSVDGLMHCDGAACPPVVEYHGIFWSCEREHEQHHRCRQLGPTEDPFRGVPLDSLPTFSVAITSAPTGTGLPPVSVGPYTPFPRPVVCFRGRNMGRFPPTGCVSYDVLYTTMNSSAQPTATVAGSAAKTSANVTMTV